MDNIDPYLVARIHQAALRADADRERMARANRHDTAARTDPRTAHRAVTVLRRRSGVRL